MYPRSPGGLLSVKHSFSAPVPQVGEVPTKRIFVLQKYDWAQPDRPKLPKSQNPGLGSRRTRLDTDVSFSWNAERVLISQYSWCNERGEIGLT